MLQEYEESLTYLTEEIQAPLLRVAGDDREKIQEIRLRSGRPLSVFDGSRSVFVTREGMLSTRPVPSCLTIDKALLEACFVRLCDYSVHTHQQEMGQGFITTPKGDRVGVCASISQTADGLVFRGVSSLNIRISRDVPDAAGELAAKVDLTGGVILAGAPSTGKTTVLRAAGRMLSSGEMGECKKVVLVDERYELTAMDGGQPRKNIGLCTDAICGIRKKDAIEQAVRTLSPQIVICDEVGSPEEVAEIRAGLASGVGFLVSVHCGTPEELWRNVMIRMLMDTGAFRSLVLLDSPQHPSRIRQVVGKEAYYAQSSGAADAV